MSRSEKSLLVCAICIAENVGLDRGLEDYIQSRRLIFLLESHLKELVLGEQLSRPLPVISEIASIPQATHLCLKRRVARRRVPRRPVIGRREESGRIATPIS